MPPAEGAALFRRTAGDGRRHTDAGVAGVLRLCGYVPQEIEMAARELRRHPAWDVSDLAARLEEIQAQDRLVGPAIELSYQHLTTAQQQVLRRIALHPDPAFSPHAAAAMAGDRSLSDTRRTLDVLLDYHLIKEPARDRFAFHDLIRDHVLIPRADPRRRRRAEAHHGPTA